MRRHALRASSTSYLDNGAAGLTRPALDLSKQKPADAEPSPFDSHGDRSHATNPSPLGKSAEAVVRREPHDICVYNRNHDSETISASRHQLVGDTLSVRRIAEDRQQLRDGYEIADIRVSNL